MSEFKCKICGGTLALEKDSTVALCEYCGTKQTLPKLSDERKNNLYDRANHFRRNNEFDKAAAIYEQLLNEDPSDAETYWSLVLCQYGIEYVEDPKTHRRLPTINRAQYTSIFSDENYKSAIKYADEEQKTLYEEEAALIDNIQKGILAISQKEEPFDVFICYKETDNNGRRTRDSALASELYNELTREGFKVFFARVTLEDKLGEAYEPYIFAALNSAKVMVVLGTKPEYLNAVWVRNEWSRYLGLIKNGFKKVLIPVYKDMDPYEMPEEFSHLQALDMTKLGFMHDLIRGVKKFTQEEAAQETKEIVTSTVKVETNENIYITITERAFMCIEDGDFEKADTLLEQALNINPKYGLAYLGKVLVDMRVRKKEDLVNCRNLYHYSNTKGNYKRALNYCEGETQELLKKDLETVTNLNLTYKKADTAYKEANAFFDFKKLKESADIFDSISSFSDSSKRKNECLFLLSSWEKKEAIYKKYEKANFSPFRTDSYLEEAKEELQNLKNYKKAEELVYKISSVITEKAEKREILKILHVILYILIWIGYIIILNKSSYYGRFSSPAFLFWLISSICGYIVTFYLVLSHKGISQIAYYILGAWFIIMLISLIFTYFEWAFMIFILPFIIGNLYTFYFLAAKLNSVKILSFDSGDSSDKK